ncbi:ribonuclease H-like domain-containing protein, partial [Tanacetum coccineum]
MPSRHPMVIQSRDGTTKPIDRLNLHVATLPPIPKTHVQASHNPHWQNAIQDEFNALIKNGMWVLVPRPPNVNVVRSMWLFKHKFHADGSLSRYKARLVANGKSQQQGIDCDETFSHVVKPFTIRTVLSLAVSRQWHIHQLDVNNAFLHGHLTETKSLYGLKQAPRAWFQRFASYALRVASSSGLLQRIISSLNGEFAMIDLGPLNYFLGISTTRTSSGIFLSLSKYAIELLEWAHMLNCNPCRTPVDTEKKLGPEGASPHLNDMKRVLRYIRGTTDLGLQLYRSSTSQLTAYSDADWAGYPATRRSTSGYYVFLGDNLLAWSLKRQEKLSRSSAEAEYRGVANAVAETSWLRNLLRELHAPLYTATMVFCDNVSSVYMSANPVQHQRTKHIE